MRLRSSGRCEKNRRCRKRWLPVGAGKGARRRSKRSRRLNFLIDYIRPQINRDIATVGLLGVRAELKRCCGLTERGCAGRFLFAFVRATVRRSAIIRCLSRGCYLNIWEGSEWPPGYLFPAKGKKGRTTSEISLSYGCRR